MRKKLANKPSFRRVIIGMTNRGGIISPAWKETLLEALDAGMDIASGLHNLLRDEKDLVERARMLGRQLIDVRVPQIQYPIADGTRRSGKRCLAVGTDCSVGKM